MDYNIDAYTIGGIVAISGGGYLLIRAYNNMKAVSFWNTIGMTVVGSAMIYAGVSIFNAKSEGEKKKDVKKIKADVTKAIAAVGDESAEAAVAAAEFSQSQRERLAKKGHALPDGSFPIRNREDLKNAVQSWGLAKNKSAAKKFIKKRAKQLDAMDELPRKW
jgi:hypothetical protein